MPIACRLATVKPSILLVVKLRRRQLACSSDPAGEDHSHVATVGCAASLLFHSHVYGRESWLVTGGSCN